MKIRTGFVSNSSSSSFVIFQEYLSEKQQRQIINYEEIGKVFGMTDVGGWEIDNDDEAIRGRTYMDNFDMRGFLSYIGVKEDVIKWDEWG